MNFPQGKQMTRFLIVMRGIHKLLYFPAARFAELCDIYYTFLVVLINNTKREFRKRESNEKYINPSFKKEVNLW